MQRIAWKFSACGQKRVAPHGHPLIKDDHQQVETAAERDYCHASNSPVDQRPQTYRRNR
jgi:hypothetical protein